MQHEYTTPAAFRPKNAAAYLGMGLTTLWEKMNPNSPYFDETFPSPFKLHGNNGRAVAFLRHELDEWLSKQSNNRAETGE